MSKDLYETEYKVGQDNLKQWGLDVHHPVFWISSGLVVLFVVGVLLAPEAAKAAFDGAKWWSIWSKIYPKSMFMRHT